MDIEMKVVKLSDIELGERVREDYGDLDELAESLKTNGFIQPLAVVKNEGGDAPYLLLAGGRRYTAAKLVGIEEVPVRIFPSKLTEAERKSIELIENIHRKNLTWQEEVKLRKQIYDLQNKHTRKTAKILDVSHSTISSDVNLAEAMKVIPEVAKAKTKAEALKKLNKIKEKMVREELKKRIEKKAVGKDKKLLIRSYIVGDFFELVKNVEAGTVDFIEVDPPYAIDLHKKKKPKDQEYMEGYNEVDAPEYPAFLSKLFKECYRVAADDTFIIVWYGFSYYNLVMEKLEEAGFTVWPIPGFWIKNYGPTRDKDRHLGSAVEAFIYAYKGHPVLNKEGHLNVFKHNSLDKSQKIHPTERPVSLMQEILNTFCIPGSRVMVPFLGSGSTLLAAANLGLTAFGFELTKKYKEAFKTRVYAFEHGHYKSLSKKNEDIKRMVDN